MESALLILQKAKANLSFNFIEVGKKIYEQGYNSGLTTDSWQKIKETGIIFKAPITTPQGGGYKSLNVTLRKKLGLYANVRPVSSFFPFVATNFPKLNVVIIRENEEDLYAGIEHRHTLDSYQCLKLITKEGCEKIIRYAFEYARAYGRKKVTCFTKDNIMKMSDGLFHKLFDEVGAEYPDLEQEHWIVDIGAAKLADTPEAFDVIVMPNLYGDILSDVAAQITGSVGLAGSANIGEGFAMFEAIHGSAPRRAGQNMANPSGLLLGAVQMLVHIGQAEVAEKVQNAWLKTLEDGVHTYDIFKEGTSREKVGTREFADAVIARIGQKPATLRPVDYGKAPRKGFTIKLKERPIADKKLVGVDVFVHRHDRNPNTLGEAVKDITGGNMKLSMITNRGVKVYPDGMPETFCTDHWRLRFKSDDHAPSELKDVINIVQQVDALGFDVIKTEHLYTMDGEPQFTAGQGQ
jgi:isocitrate dehydrogenase